MLSKKIDIGILILVLSCVLSFSFLFWILVPNEIDKAQEFYSKYQKLSDQGENAEVVVEIEKALGIKDSVETPLHIVWLPTVNQVENAYTRLWLHKRLLMADPKSERVIQSLVLLLNSLPEQIRDEVTENFMQDIAKIEGINLEYFNKVKVRDSDSD